MTKFKKTVQHLGTAELTLEAKKLSEQLKTAQLGKMSGKSKNLREAFILRKKLAIVKSYESLHR